ncbi:MAG: Crp/Fnr family transcriptional regulator [Alphaproteobacteria bacterium]
MSEVLKEYAKGDIIFREGDISNLAYIVVQGSVDIFKKGISDPIATIKNGDIIGEMSAIDGKPRSCSAMAKTKVILEEIKASQLKEQIEKDKDFSLSIIKSLIKRMRDTDNKLSSTANNQVERINTSTNVEEKDLSAAQESSTQVKTEDNVSNFNFMGWLFGSKANSIFNLYLPSIMGDKNNQLRNQLLEFFETLDFFNANKASDCNNVTSYVKQISKKNGDILLKCEINYDSNILAVALITKHPNPYTYTNILHNSFKFYIPISAEDGNFSLLKCLIAGFVNPRSKKQKDALAAILPSFIDDAKTSLASPKLHSPQLIAYNLICFGVVCFNLYNLNNDDKWLKTAIEIFQKTLSIPNNQTEISFAGNFLLAQCYSCLCNKKEYQESNMNLAVKHYNIAKTLLNSSIDAEKLAIIDSQISFICSTVGMVEGRKDDLLNSITCAKSALAYFSSQKEISKWSAVANNMAQTMQFYGNLYGDIDYIKSSIEAFELILATRDKKKNPLLWAETKNNLASSCFILGKYTNNNKDFQEAAEAFEEAANIYKTHKQEKQAHVSLRNHKLATEACAKTAAQKTSRDETWRLEFESKEDIDEIPSNINEDEWSKELLDS